MILFQTWQCDWGTVPWMRYMHSLTSSSWDNMELQLSDEPYDLKPSLLNIMIKKERQSV